MNRIKKVIKLSCVFYMAILLCIGCDEQKEGLLKETQFVVNNKISSNKQLLLNGIQEAINAKYKNVIKEYYGMDELKVFKKYFSNLVVKQEDIDDETSLLCIAYYLCEVNGRWNDITNESANICIYKLIERGNLTFPNKAFKELEWKVFFVNSYKKYENEFNEFIAEFKKLGIDEINNHINEAKEKVNDEIYYDGLRNQY